MGHYPLISPTPVYGLSRPPCRACGKPRGMHTSPNRRPYGVHATTQQGCSVIAWRTAR